jgi:ribosomal protein S18 acetylase RimI-like enzyme
MLLQQELVEKGFSITDVDKSDFDTYFIIGRACYEKYVDEYFGGWVEDFQIKMNTDAFNAALKQSTFKKILLNDEIIGFFAFDELDEKIDGVSIQMIEKARNKGVGSYYLKHIISLSERDEKPVVLKVFKSNPAQNLYRRFGFKVYEDTYSHHLMRYDPMSNT